MAYKQGLGLALGVCGCLLVGCGGGDEKAPTSTIETPTAGAGGMAGAAGSLTIGNGANGGSGGSGGMASPSPPTIATFHTCGMPEQECGLGTHAGDVKVTTKADLEALKGVGAIEGKLEIRITSGTVGFTEILDDLGCLGSVSGDVSVQFSNTEGDVSLWGLRNLTTVGGNLVVSNTFVRTFTDCGLAKLVSVGPLEGPAGHLEFDHVGGDLDLSKLTRFGELRVHDTELDTVKLPQSGTFEISYFQLSNNTFLRYVEGLREAAVQFVPTSSTRGVQIVNNPSLPGCRVDELAQLFIAGGAAASDITKSANGPCEAP
jgi:hypothetical protein